MKIHKNVAALTCLCFFLLFLNGLSAQTSTWQFIDNCPDDSLEGVNVWFSYQNGAIRICHFMEYLMVTEFITLDSGPVTISLAFGTSLPFFSKTFTPTSNTMIAILNGVADTMAYPGIDTLHIDVMEGKAFSGSSTQNDIMVHNGSPDAPVLNFTTTLNPPTPLGSNLLFRDYAQGYTPLGFTDSLIKVYDPLLMDVNRTYLLPSEFWDSLGQAGVIFSSGFVDPSFSAAAPHFHLYYAPNQRGMAIPLVELSNDAPVYIQDKHSLAVWFGPIDTFAFPLHRYDWTFFDTSGTAFYTDTTGNPIVEYPDTGTYPVTLTVDNGIFVSSFNVDVRCPVPNIQYEIEQNGMGSVTIHNTTVLNPSWTYTWQWTFGNQTSTAVSPTFLVPPDACGYIEVTGCVTANCGSTACYTVSVRLGYIPDKPLREKQCLFTPHRTPIAWERPDYWFPADQIHDHIDDALAPLLTNQTAEVDILAYYYVPECSVEHDIVQDKLKTLPGYYGICEFLTVASFRGVTMAEITQILNMSMDNNPDCHPVVFIASDMPDHVDPNLNVDQSHAYLKAREIMESYGMTSEIMAANSASGTGEGNGIGIGIIAGKRNVHFAFNSLPVNSCSTSTSTTTQLDYSANYVDFTTTPIDWRCNWNGLTCRDETGDRAAGASLLTTQNHWDILDPIQTAGLCPKAMFYFWDVEDGNQNIRPFHVLQAFEFAIHNKCTENRISILICDFSMPGSADDNEAIATMANIASMYGMVVVAGTGTIGGSLPSPSVARQVLTAASVVYDDGVPFGMADGQGQGQWQLSDGLLLLSPAISAPCNAKGANPNDYTDFSRPIANTEVPAYIVAGAAALICEMAPHFNLEKLKESLRISADINIPNTSSGPDEIKGHGVVDLESASRTLKNARPCDLGFREYYDIDPCANSKDIDIAVCKIAGGPKVIQPGDTVFINVTITNFGDNSYDATYDKGTVSLKIHKRENLPKHPYDVAFLEQPIPPGNIDPGSTKVVTFKYIAKDVMDIFCAEASINCICDCITENDIAKRNNYRICFSRLARTETTSRQFFGPNALAYIFHEYDTLLPINGFTYSSSFTDGFYAADDYPFYAFDTITYDTTVTNPSGELGISYYAVIGADTFYYGGLAYTFQVDSVIVGTPEISTTPTNNISIFPVPATQTVTVQVRPGTSGPGTIEMFTLMGQMIERREVKWQRDITKEEIFQLDDLPAGVYLFKISLGDRTTFKKLVKV